MQPELKPPPQKYSALVIVSAVVTALLAIAGLTWLGKSLSGQQFQIQILTL